MNSLSTFLKYYLYLYKYLFYLTLAHLQSLKVPSTCQPNTLSNQLENILNSLLENENYLKISHCMYRLSSLPTHIILNFSSSSSSISSIIFPAKHSSISIQKHCEFLLLNFCLPGPLLHSENAYKLNI